MYEIESYDDEARMYYEYCQYEYQKAKESESKELNQRKHLKGENYEFNNNKRSSRRDCRYIFKTSYL